jgi:DNA-binding CsgD family transcriptional regulator
MIFGSCLNLIWIYAILFASFPILQLSATKPTQIINTLNVVPLLLFMATALVMAIIGRRITYFIRMRSVQLCMAVLLAFGTVILFQSLRLELYPLALFAYLVCGTTAGFFTLIWSEVFRRQETPSIVLNTIFGQALAFVGFGMLRQFAGSDLGGIILGFLPLLQVGLLLFTLHGFQALTQPQRFEYDASGARVAVPGLLEIPTFHRLRVQRPFFMARMGGPSFLFGIAFGPLTCWCFTLVSGSDSNLPAGLGAMLLVAAALLALLVVILLLTVNRADEYDSFYRFVIPLLSIMLFFTSMLHEVLPLTLLVFSCFILFFFMIWVEFCEMSHRYRISPILVTGTGLGFLFAGMLVGTGLFLTLQDNPQFDSGPTVFTTLMIICMLLGYFLMPRAKSIMEMAISEDSDSAEKGGPPYAAFENRGRFVRRCEKVANTYLLSNRELDVFYLLAKGRNAAYIAQKLYIAEGTVNTHTWRIYRKLNVHSQQELIELVDTMPLEQDRELTSAADLVGGSAGNNTSTKKPTPVPNGASAKTSPVPNGASAKKPMPPPSSSRQRR